MERQNKEEETAGKYKWLVLFCCGVVNALTWGTLYSCGVLYASWSSHFKNSSEAFISLVGALPVSIGCLLGPVYGMIITKYGFQKSSIFGGLLTSFGWSISALMVSMEGLFWTFGIVTGFGAGLTNFAAGNALNEYFVKDRLVAEGVIGSSVCLGMFFSTELLQLLTELYCWEGAMLISGAFHLHLCICGFLLVSRDRSATFSLNCCRNTEILKKSEEEEIEEIVVMPEADHNGNIISNEKPLIVPTVKVETEQRALRQLRGDRSFLEFLRISVRLWRRPIFVFLAVSDTLSWMAYYVPFVHLVERARLSGIDDDTSARISAFNGVGGTVGKVLISILFQRLKIHPLNAYSFTQVFTGLITILSPFWSTTEGLFVYSTLFGFFSGGYGFIKAAVAQMLGRDQYAISFSWFLMLEGIGIAIGPTVGGVLYDFTKSYRWTFVSSGSLIFVSGAMCWLKGLVTKFDTPYDEKASRKARKLTTSRSTDDTTPIAV